MQKFNGEYHNGCTPELSEVMAKCFNLHTNMHGKEWLIAEINRLKFDLDWSKKQHKQDAERTGNELRHYATRAHELQKQVDILSNKLEALNIEVNGLNLR